MRFRVSCARDKNISEFKPDYSKLINKYSFEFCDSVEWECYDVFEDDPSNTMEYRELNGIGTVSYLEIPDLETLLQFRKDCGGRIVLRDTYSDKSDDITLEIYDDYRE